MAKKKRGKISWWEIVTTTFRAISVGFSILMFIVFLLIFASVITLMGGTEDLRLGNVAVVPIKGMITTGDYEGLAIKAAKSQDIINSIEDAEENKRIKAIVLDIDSPGGAPVASDDIAKAVRRAGKPVIAVIGETGASGAFWIATAADKIFANRMSVTGSIGVRGSYLEWAGVMKDYNVTYRRLIAGEYKDAGTPYKKLTEEEEQKYQKVLDELHEEFIKAVAENRELSIEQVREDADGFIFLGIEAKEKGYVDELGNKYDAFKHIEQEMNITAEPVIFKKTQSFAELLGTMSTEGFYNIGRGIGTSFNTEPRATLS